MRKEAFSGYGNTESFKAVTLKRSLKKRAVLHQKNPKQTAEQQNE